MWSITAYMPSSTEDRNQRVHGFAEGFFNGSGGKPFFCYNIGDGFRIAGGLYALQHRGQESCGIVVNDDGIFASHKDLGLVGEVFPQAVHPQKRRKRSGRPSPHL